MYPFSYKSLTRRHRGGLVLPQPLSLNLAVPNTNSWDEAENCIPEEKPRKIITCVCEHILLSGEYPHPKHNVHWGNLGEGKTLWLPESGKTLERCKLSWMCLLHDSQSSQRNSCPFSSSGLSDPVPPRWDLWDRHGVSWQQHHLLQPCDVSAEIRWALHESLDREPGEKRPTAPCWRKNERTSARQVGARST